MRLTRRELFRLSASTLPLALASSSLFASAPANRMYRESIIIDGLGGPGEPGSEPGSPISDRAVEHVRTSGLTAALFGTE